MQFVRQSKFRHVFCKPMKTEFCLNDVRITKVSHDSLFCAVNSKFIAIITEGSGGPFMVIPLTKVGRVEKDYPVVDAHKAPCLEIAWCPFNENVIASGSEDTTVKVWHIPDRGLNRNLTEPLVQLLGHQRRVCCIVWHPSANNILLTAAADLKIFMWNVGTGEALIEIAGHPDLIWSVSFNFNGSKIVTTCKDKRIRVIDPRTGKVLQQGAGHEGVKPQRAVYLRDGRILTTGFTKRSERMYSLRDEESLEEPIVQDELDTSNGVLFPFYDGDTGMVYLIGKGDSAIRYYEVNNDSPFVHYINIYSSPEPQRGIAFMPKLGLSVTDNEIARVYKCTNKGLVEVLQFFVPRKSELFQDDLFPDTPGPVPAMTADDWINGKDSDPVMVPVHVDKPSPVRPVMMGRGAESGSSGSDKPKKSAAASGAAKKTNILGQIQAPPPAEPAPSPVLANRASSASTTLSVAAAAAKPPSPVEILPPLATTKAEQALSELRHQGSRAPTQSKREREPAGHAENMNARPPATRSSASEYPYQDISPSSTPMASRQNSTTSSHRARSPSGLSARSASDPNYEEILSDIQKLKAVVRRHERRIRFLEDQLAERDMVDLND